MPLYEYECRKCHHRFEIIQTLSEKPVRRCPKCRTGTVQKLVSSPAVHFKGSGWYVTDYGRKGKAGADADGESGAKESGSGAKESQVKPEKADKPSDTGADTKKGPKKG